MNEKRVLKKSIKIILCIVIASLIFMSGISIGQHVFPNREIIIQQVRDESSKYIFYFDIINEYLYPFNETDNVTAHIYDKNLHIDHTVPNQRGMSYFTLIPDNEGFIRNIEQRRDQLPLPKHK